jgi:hypothetical protein
MHAAWGKATGQGGTGAQTLTAVSGFPTLEAAAGVGVPFSYVARDPSTKLPLEAGYGLIATAGAQMQRTVRLTWDGSTLNKATPSAVNLPSGVLLDTSPQSATLEAAMMTVDANSGVGRFLTTASRNISTSNGTLTAGRLYYLPFLLRCGAVIGSMACNITTGQASSSALMGIYAMGTTGAPGAKLAETGSIDTTTASFKTPALTSSIFLAPGWYYVAFLYIGTAGVAATLHASSTAALLGGSPCGFNGNSFTGIDHRYETVGSLALPSTAGATSAVNVAAVFPPVMALGVA